MGTPKAWLPFGGEPMLTRVVRIVGAVAAPIVVVAAEGMELPPLPPDTRVAHDRRPDQGPLEGLLAGLESLGADCDAAFVTSCDVPLLVPALIRHLQGLLEDSRVVVPVDDSFAHPLCAVYRRDTVVAIRELLAAGESRPRALFERVATRRVQVESLRALDPELDSLRNLNRPEDYERALREAESRGLIGARREQMT